MKSINQSILLIFSILLPAITANAQPDDTLVTIQKGKQITCPYFSMTAQTTCEFGNIGFSVDDIGNLFCRDKSNPDNILTIFTRLDPEYYIDDTADLIQSEIIKNNSSTKKWTMLKESTVIMDELLAKIVGYKGEISKTDNNKNPYTLYNLTYAAIVDLFYTPPRAHANTLVIYCEHESIGKPVDETEAEKICMKYFESFKLKNNKIRQKCNCKK